MTPTLWMVQENLGNTTTHDAIKRACERNGLPFRSITSIPFSDDLPDVEYAGPVLAYGATRFINNVVRSGRWKPGAFFDEAIFTVANCIRAWDWWMVNADSTIVRLDRVNELPFAPADEVFVRPNSDLKEFAGGIMTFAALRDWAEIVSKGDFELKRSLLIAVAVPKPIESEWRVFAVDGARVIAGTRYRLDGRLAPDAAVPDNVVSFVESRLREWMPTPAVALDIANVDGELRILELSDIHSAGHYAANTETIVLELSRLAERLWDEGFDAPAA